MKRNDKKRKRLTSFNLAQKNAQIIIRGKKQTVFHFMTFNEQSNVSYPIATTKQSFILNNFFKRAGQKNLPVKTDNVTKQRPYLGFKRPPFPK